MDSLYFLLPPRPKTLGLNSQIRWIGLKFGINIEKQDNFQNKRRYPVLVNILKSSERKSDECSVYTFQSARQNL